MMGEDQKIKQRETNGELTEKKMTMSFHFS